MSGSYAEIIPAACLERMDIKKKPLESQTSFMDDPRVVQTAKEPAFFWLEPGIGVILAGSLLEADKHHQILTWLVSLGGGIYLSSKRSRLARLFSLGLVLFSLRPFGDGKYFRFLFGMATVMRVLRVIEVLNDPEHFATRGDMYTIKYCFLYHDLRRASCFDTEQEQESAEHRSIHDLIFNAMGIILTSMVLRIKLVLRHRLLIAIASMLRFYSFISLAEAGYRLHLNKFGIRAPVCFDEPWRSQTVGEFWGKRWNLAIAQQLRNVVFKPVSNYTGNRKLGELAIFAASSALHMIPVVSLGGSQRAIASTAVFFLIQPGLIAFEKSFHLKGVPWVHLALWSCAPLFSLPLYEVT